jgi:hypothetical protein
MRTSMLFVVIGLVLGGCAHAPSSAPPAEQETYRRSKAPQMVLPMAPPPKKPPRAGVLAPSD